MTFGCKSVGTPRKTNVNLLFDGSLILDDPRKYRKLIEKLIYLTIIGSNITFAVGVLSRFMHQPREAHWTVVLMILAYVKSSPDKGLLYMKHGHLRISGYSDLVMLVTRG